jgi:hypothetical protein
MNQALQKSIFDKMTRMSRVLRLQVAGRHAIFSFLAVQ